jgi:hypothetical protein
MRAGVRSDHVSAIGALSLGLALSCATPAIMASVDEPTDSRCVEYDCGTLSLYTLLQLEGSTVNLRAVDGCLGCQPPTGFSIKQLRDAAGSLGMRLTAVRISNDGSLDRPALLFSRSSSHGHFIVIRPVGHTGKLVQVFDSLRDPEVVDISVLVKSSGWTGYALIPSRFDWPAWIGPCLLGGVTAWGVAAWLVARRRRQSATYPIAFGQWGTIPWARRTIRS